MLLIDSVFSMFRSCNAAARVCDSLQNRDGGGEAADQLDVYLPLCFPQGEST